MAPVAFYGKGSLSPLRSQPLNLSFIVPNIDLFLGRRRFLGRGRRYRNLAPVGRELEPQDYIPKDQPPWGCRVHLGLALKHAAT